MRTHSARWVVGEGAKVIQKVTETEIATRLVMRSSPRMGKRVRRREEGITLLRLRSPDERHSTHRERRVQKKRNQRSNRRNERRQRSDFANILVRRHGSTPEITHMLAGSYSTEEQNQAGVHSCSSPKTVVRERGSQYVYVERRGCMYEQMEKSKREIKNAARHVQCTLKRLCTRNRIKQRQCLQAGRELCGAFNNVMDRNPIEPRHVNSASTLCCTVGFRYCFIERQIQPNAPNLL